jgi:cytochrome c
MLRRIFSLALVSSVALAGSMTSAMAQERGSKQEAIKMVDAAYEHMAKVGDKKANADFTEDKANWVNKDLYVFVFDSKGAFMSHGANAKLVGRDMSNMKDANGKAIFPAMQETAAKGTGWVDYDWAHPQTKRIEAKSTYVRKTPDGAGLIGVGIYR